jgi:hypothetical protein
MSKIEVNAIEPQCGTNLTVGASGDTITFPSGTTIVNNGSQTGFGRTGTVDWDTTPKTATFSAVSGNGYFCNTSGGAFTVNLPAGSAGAIVSLADYAATWQTNNLTVSPNGSEKIGSVNADVTLNTEGQSVTFVYVDSTQGWINTMDSTSNVRGNPNLVATGGTITTCGNCKIHTFTGPGTFTVTNASQTADENIVSYMVVAGGGGGGGEYGGGGGAGGYREVKSPLTPYTASPLDGYPSAPNRVTVTATSFPITVGGGGVGGSIGAAPPVSTNGGNSVFSTVTSAGGGAGRYNNPPGDVGSGGSGGGGDGGGGGCAGTGNTPPVSPPQGNNGGGVGGTGVPHYGRAGGGGAGAVGSPGTPTAGGAGGAGTTSSINGTPTARAGGGGGGVYCGPATGGAGGPGGGGASPGSGTGVSGTVNTGGGGGGSSYAGGPATGGGAGGSGIVIIRYKFQ